MKVSSNLPPGVTGSMIPGNRPEDAEWDAFCEWVSELVENQGGDLSELVNCLCIHFEVEVPKRWE